MAIRKYLHQDFKAWHARLLARQDVEMSLDKYARQCRDPSRRNTRVVHNIMESRLVQTFLGKDGSEFLQCPDDELRLVWGFAFDSFDPHHMKPGRKSISSTAIYLILMNLPPDLRFREENMFLIGIIPGPGKPSLDEINHYTRLIVNDLLVFWDPGVFFSATASHPEGRLALGALIPIICDLPAARQISGFAGHSATYLCSICLLERDDIENIMKSSWNYRTREAHARSAAVWLTLPTKKARATHIREGGVRWTEFLRLPYWNPIRFTVIETMHTHFLRNLMHHISYAWGMDAALPCGDGLLCHKVVAPPCAVRAQPRHWKAKEDLLWVATRETLQSQPHAVLWHLCYDRGLRRAGSARMLAGHLIEWVQILPKHDIGFRCTDILIHRGSANHSKQDPAHMDTGLQMILVLLLAHQQEPLLLHLGEVHLIDWSTRTLTCHP